MYEEDDVADLRSVALQEKEAMKQLSEKSHTYSS